MSADEIRFLKQSARSAFRAGGDFGFKGDDGRIYSVTGFAADRVTFVGFASMSLKPLSVSDFHIILPTPKRKAGR